jgi:hypothetical protein
MGCGSFSRDNTEQQFQLWGDLSWIWETFCVRPTVGCVSILIQTGPVAQGDCTSQCPKVSGYMSNL